MSRTRLAELALFLLLSILYYANPWRLFPGPVEAWGIPFLLCYTALFPGVFIRRIVLGRHEDALAAALLQLLFGLFYLLLVFFIWTVAGFSLGALQFALPAALALPWLLSWRHELRLIARAGASMQTGVQPGPPPRPAIRAGAIIVLVVCIPIFLAIWKSGPSIAFTRDTLDHAGYVSEIRDTGKAFPLTALYADAGDDGKDMRKGLLHACFAFPCRYLGIDALASIGAWNAFCALILVFGVYGAAFMLFGNQWIAALASLLFLAESLNGMGEASLRESYYGSRFGFCYVLFLIVFALHYLEKKERRLLAACACFAFAAAAVHIMFAVLAAFVFAIILVWKACFPQNTFKEHVLRVLAAFFVSMAGIAPYALYRYFTAYSAGNDLHRELQGVAYITSGTFIADPFKLFSWFGAAGLVAFAACIPLWKERRTHSGIGYLIAASITIPVVLLNPILLPPLQRALTYLVLRLPQIAPHYIVAAFFIVHFIRTRGAPGAQQRGAKAADAGPAGGGAKARGVPSARQPRAKAAFSTIVFAGMAAAVIMELAPLVHTTVFSPSKLRTERRNSYLLWSDGLDFLRDSVPAGSIIAGDPLTCYSIAALTPQYVTCTFDQHAPPGDHSLLRRIRASRNILSPFVPLSETIDNLKALRAEYVVVNNRIPATFVSHFWTMDAGLFPRIRDKFLSHPDCFETLYDRAGFLVFRWTGSRPPAEEPPANPYFLETIPSAFTRIGREAGVARLEAARTDRDVVARNDSLRISLVWSKSRPYELRNYVVMVRFDHANPDLPLGGKPFSKLTRKATEAITHRRYRFRSDHKIAAGMLGPDAWPDGAFVLDRAAVGVPPNMVPGRYTVSVKLLDVPVIQNIRLRDVLYDDDTYQGLAVADIEIR